MSNEIKNKTVANSMIGRLSEEDMDNLSKLSENHIKARVDCIKQFAVVCSAMSALVVLRDAPDLLGKNHILVSVYHVASYLLLLSTVAFLVSLYLYLPVLHSKEIEAYVRYLCEQQHKEEVVGQRIPFPRGCKVCEKAGYLCLGIALLLLLLCSFFAAL